MPVITVATRVRVRDNSAYTGRLGSVVSVSSGNVFQVRLDGWAIGRTFNFTGQQLEFISQPAPAPAPGPGGGSNTGGGIGRLRYVLTSAQVLARSLTLSVVPADPSLVTLDVRGLPRQFAGPDFSVSGAVVSWADVSQGLYGLLEAGDIVIVEY